MADLAKREADIALRFTQTPPLDMVGRKVSQMDMWLLIHPDLRGVKRIDALKELLIGMF